MSVDYFKLPLHRLIEIAIDARLSGEVDAERHARIAFEQRCIIPFCFGNELLKHKELCDE